MRPPLPAAKFLVCTFAKPVLRGAILKSVRTRRSMGGSPRSNSPVALR